ncbi:hypothetical protein TSAR_014260 [Trichomalopsis sarcophagae]|uniref:FYVE-type domain-containing protein n=1 Tax=Trichomalopsis sarcophagae TaxID=543379 RepID=A0A232ETB2_9HYME|nr:hypothetical protein TSAR_014260 [Trichomalopsis sarcophagae]
MEKFAVDKVLDEFDFNSDRAEQMPSASAPPMHPSMLPAMHSSMHPVMHPQMHQPMQGLPMQYGIPNVYHQPPMPAVNSELGMMNMMVDPSGLKGNEMNLMKEQEYLAAGNMDNLRKSELLVDNLDSINHFYTHDSLLDDKLQHKLNVNVGEAEPSALTIHNDISQKLPQKQPNDHVLINSYEKKLNQSHMQLGVGNVFNNFNEYMSAPSVSLLSLDDENVASNMYNTIPCEGMVNMTDSCMSSFVKHEKCSIDDLLTTEVQDMMDDKKDHNAAPPKYQNILLPIKLDTCNKSSETKTDGIEPDLEFPDLMTDTNQAVSAGFDKPDKVVKSILDEPEHVYENVYIGTDIPKTQQVFNNPLNKQRKVDPEIEHTYENVSFGTQSISSVPQDKDGVYECIYISNRDNLPETNTELEIAAKKMADHLNLKESESQNVCPIPSAASTNIKPVFQNVQLDSVQVPEPKSVIGFTEIDDMSEEELSKYLADLEAEERANERAAAVYENIAVDNNRENLKTSSLPIQQQDDEDANEAPIFEAVTIGELPQVPQQDLAEKAKKFPVIDYNIGTSSSSSSGEISNEFSCPKKPETAKISLNQVKADDESKVKKSKKTNEKVRKSSDNTEPTSQASSQSEQMSNNEDKDTEKDEENGNYVTTNESDDKQNNLDAKTLALAEENKNFNCTESTTSEQLDNTDVKNLQNNDQNIIITSDDNKLANTRTPVRNTETISRFSVTRNVDVNDKLGGRPIPSQSHNIVKHTEHSNSELDESSDDDPNRPSRPQTLNVVSTVNTSDSSAGACCNQETSDVEGDKDSGRVPSPDVSENSSMESGTVLGKQPPFWVPDSDAPNCMLCDMKFTVVKRRHHCRACGKVFCNKCCSNKLRLEYQKTIDSRVCIPCYLVLTKPESDTGSGDYAGFSTMNSTGINSPQGRPPNPNNPMEYCSKIPPLEQLAGGLPPAPPTVMVPVGVLKREGSSKQRSEGPKSVMFSDGIRPGCDLTELDTSWDWKGPSAAARNPVPRRTIGAGYVASSSNKKQNCPPIDAKTNSYIPQDPAALPPTVTIHKGQITYHQVTDPVSLCASLKNECEPPVMFAIQRNLFALVKIINLNCCVNRICWNVTSKGLACVGQDEIVFLVETLPDETQVPKDLLLHINLIYHEAAKGNTIPEYGMSIHQEGNLLGSREHVGFLFIRQTLQCLQKVIVPPAPFLVGLLVHRWETPWAKVFPLRLVLRLGAEYRYYPCPLVSVRLRNSVYLEIGHTIMKVLADFRNFAYTLPKVQGMTIHMEGNSTNVRFPKNRYNQVIKGLNNSNDHVLAFASNFSIQADSHLVCIQVAVNNEEDSGYQTQAINIQNKPRKVTGASFIVINGALKSSMGLSAKSSIVEDGLMVQIMPEKMEALKAALKNMQDFTIGCGKQGAPEPDEIVNIKWVENDTQFNLGVKSPIDGKPMDGIPSIRVHNGINYVGTSRFIRWTEVFIIKSDDDQPFGMHYPVDINKLSESIARATCTALVKLLDLLANAGLVKIAVRATIQPDNVGYEAGSEGTRLPPIYMNSLDNELVQVLQKAVQGCEDTQIVLELVFYVLETEN